MNIGSHVKMREDRFKGLSQGPNLFITSAVILTQKPPSIAKVTDWISQRFTISSVCLYKYYLNCQQTKDYILLRGNPTITIVAILASSKTANVYYITELKYKDCTLYMMVKSDIFEDCFEETANILGRQLTDHDLRGYTLYVGDMYSDITPYKTTAAALDILTYIPIYSYRVRGKEFVLLKPERRLSHISDTLISILFNDLKKILCL